MTSGFDMTTRYLGLELAHPVVPSSSPLTGDIDHLHELAEAGAPAVVLPSLFEEQVIHDALSIHRGLDQSAGAQPEAPEGYFPELDDYNTGPGGYLDLLTAAKRELSIPVIASLNGDSFGGWTLYARILQDRGADALELNIYHIAADANESGSAVEAMYLKLVESVRDAVDIPFAVKIGPYFSSLGSFAHKLASAGADGLVLFNRFYQPDLDLDTLKVKRDLDLSRPSDSRLALRWIGMLSGRVDCDLAATTGIHSGSDVVKMLLVGADITMMAAALLLNGPAHLRTVVDDANTWFEERDYTSVSQARGSMSHEHVADPSGFERANYMKALTEYAPDWA
jgi:dihydroorotate dehydrogenase (fumarate)